MRTGLHLDPDVHVLIYSAVILIAGRRLYRENLYPLAVERNLNLLRTAQAFYVLVAISRKAHLYFIFGVHWEGKMHHGATAGTEGKFVETCFLRKVRRELYHEIIARCFARRAYSQAANLS